jgi:hypothetical protein
MKLDRTAQAQLEAVSFRVAALADLPALRALIELSARALSRDDYSERQNEAALSGAWGSTRS